MKKKSKDTLPEFPETPYELSLNANKYGIPTFEQFKKNPDLYRAKKDDIFSTADNGSKILNRYIESVWYEVDGYKCRTPEEAERVCINQGYDLTKLKLQPQLETSQGNFKANLIIKFICS